MTQERPIASRNAPAGGRPEVCRPCEIAAGLSVAASILQGAGRDPTPLLRADPARDDACALLTEAVRQLEDLPEEQSWLQTVLEATFPGGCPGRGDKEE